MRKIKPYFMLVMVGILVLLLGVIANAQPFPRDIPIADDPLLRMPGTQPNQVPPLVNSADCSACHGSWSPGPAQQWAAFEIFENWQGSMMAQAARDFLFFACLTVAGQDSVWALGNANAVDICERCHFPKGWLEGRSEPPNASAMTGGDYDGVQCTFCHIMADPFFKTTFNGTREGNDWLVYWDEQNNPVLPPGFRSQPRALNTYKQDKLWSALIKRFNADNFYVNFNPFSAFYTENGGGQFFVSPQTHGFRGPFADAFWPGTVEHQRPYSRYHKSKFFCSTCHDVSNPALANLGQIIVPPGPGFPPLHTEKFSASSYFHVERTFSEFMLSAYGLQGGATGKGPFRPAVFTTSLPGNFIARCQDCHFRDRESPACDDVNMVRPSGSPEHINSGMPQHDMTGGNIWVTTVLATAANDSPIPDPVNAALLNQGPNVLTLDLNQGIGLDANKLIKGANRVRTMLQRAATITNLNYNPATGAINFRVQNNTGHKLISGFPEGRRMFLNVKAYNGATLIYEVNPYDYTVGTLKGLPNGLPLGPNEVYRDRQVYEAHPRSAITGENETFHFVLATSRYKDNRIPPKGFRIAEAQARLSEPVDHGQSNLNYFSAAEYAGGYDHVAFTIPTGATSLEVNLFYQTTSREYIEFLRDEINGVNQTLPASAYIIQTHPFFAKLKAWGDTIFQLWDHNKNVDGAKPFLMTQKAWP